MVVHHSHPTSDASPTLTVIVPCYNSERTIRQCLNSIISQRTDVEFDVIVVYSSSDQTARIVELEFPSVRLIKLNQRAFAGESPLIELDQSNGGKLKLHDSRSLIRGTVNDDHIELNVSPLANNRV